MKMQPDRFVAKLGDDEIILETGQLAGQAGGGALLVAAGSR